MKSFVLACVAMFAVALCSTAKAGPFSLDSLTPAMAFDVADTGAPAPAAVDPRITALMDQIAQLKAQVQQSGAAQTRAALARQPRQTTAADLNSVLSVTKGQCARGKCGQ